MVPSWIQRRRVATHLFVKRLWTVLFFIQRGRTAAVLTVLSTDSYLVVNKWSKVWVYQRLWLSRDFKIIRRWSVCLHLEEWWKNRSTDLVSQSDVIERGEVKYTRLGQREISAVLFSRVSCCDYYSMLWQLWLVYDEVLVKCRAVFNWIWSGFLSFKNEHCKERMDIRFLSRFWFNWSKRTYSRKCRDYENGVNKRSWRVKVFLDNLRLYVFELWVTHANGWHCSHFNVHFYIDDILVCVSVRACKCTCGSEQLM